MKRSYIQRNTKIFAIVLLMLQAIACKKFIDIDAPSNTINVENVYSSDKNAIAVLTGIYSLMSAANSGLSSAGAGLPFMTVYPGLSADELTLFLGVENPELQSYYSNTLQSNNVVATNFWRPVYKHLFVINSAIEGLTASQSLTPSVKRQLLGEAYFLRAFCHFYLTNLYGEVPLITKTDYSETALQGKASVTDIYNQIKSDLKEAQTLLSNDYLSGTLLSTTGERVRPTKSAATALLARAYLYTEDFVNAESEATKIIDNQPVYALGSLENAFLKNTKETIWSLMPVGQFNDQNTGEGKLFILPLEGPGMFDHQVYLSNQLMKSFEKGDQRYSRWTDSVESQGTVYHYSYKYKIGNQDAPPTEYPIVLRTAEQYLIRAEARIQQNKVAEGIYDLNAIRDRAIDKTEADPEKRLTLLPATLSQTAALTAVLHERQVELFTEWGHRWLDLKRTKNIDNVMSKVSIAKGGTWDSHSTLYPIPLREVQSNPNLKQNSGY